MPIPANVSMVDITGAYTDADGAPSVGEVYIDAVPDYVLDATAVPPTTIGLNRYIFTLDENGEIPAGSEIIATDDADLNPTGWTYKVVVNLRSSGKRIDWYMTALTAASPIDLTVAAPVDSDMGVPTAVGPIGPPGVTGVRVVGFGDSTVIANSSNSPTWGTRDFLGWAHLISRGAFRYVRNAGIGGDDTTEALARFDTDVTPYSPDVVFVVLGINDAVTGFTVAQYAAGIRAIVARVRSINARPWLFTVAPNLNTGAVQQRIAIYNAWLREYSSIEGLVLIDTNSTLTDPATGSYLTAYNLDGTHQNEAGGKAMGQLVADAVALQLAKWSPPLAVSNTADEGNLVSGGLFLANTGGLGTGWSRTGGTVSIVAGVAPVKGNWQRLTDVAVEAANVRQNIVIGTVVAGDVIEFSGRVRTVQGTSTATWSLFFNCIGGADGVLYVANLRTLDVDGAFTARIVVPTGTTSLQVQLARTCTVVGTGYSEIAQVTAKNLTAQGVLVA